MASGKLDPADAEDRLTQTAVQCGLPENEAQYLVKLGLNEGAWDAEFDSTFDALQRFLDEGCVFEPNASTSAQELYEAYVGWCRQVGKGPMCEEVVGMCLGDRDVSSGAGSSEGRTSWSGIRLLEPVSSGS
jgi:hypothetical protein